MCFSLSSKILTNTIIILALSGCFCFAGDLEASDENKKTSENLLYVNPASHDFSQNPELLERILSGPHGYFRFINIPFSQAVCRRFADLLAGAPSLNLHGDAHIEQYAITDIGRGIPDFDDSSTGPGIIDLMRFGVSLHLACQANGWQSKSTKMFDKFLSGYRSAMKKPKLNPEEPGFAKQIRAKFTIDRESYFKWVASIMQPIPQSEQDSLITAIKPYIETKLAEDSSLEPPYFRIESCGYLKMGIGSALDKKYLVRIRGKSDDPMDDVVLEFKEVRDLSGIDCINSGQGQDPFRILLGQTRIAYQPFLHLGYFRFKGRNFWVHSWVDNYKEVNIYKSFSSPEALAEVVYDIGVQLGKGHVKHIASPLDLQLRRAQLRLLNAHEADIKIACRELTQKTVEAWKRFSETVSRIED